MKTPNLIFFFIWFFVEISSAQKPFIKLIVQEQFTPNHKQILALSLRIEQVFNRYNHVIRQEYFYPDLNGKMQSDRKKVYSYDSRGFHLNTLEYNGDNILEAETKIYWDDHNNKSKIEQISYANGQKVNVAVTYQLFYDPNGNKERETYYSSTGKTIKERKWFYNKNNEIIRSKSLISRKNHPQKEISIQYQRDKIGDLFKSITKEKVNGKIYRKDVRLFNNGYVIRWKKFIVGKFESEFVNEYRDSVIIRTTRRKNRKIIPVNENSKVEQPNKKPKSLKEDEIWMTNTEYDAYGNEVISTQSINDKVIIVIQYEYDPYGNKTRSLEINKETKQKDEEKVEYEDFGNISKRTILKNDLIVSEEIFTYEYFTKD